MLEEKTYSISELAAIIGGSSKRQTIKRKLERRHILYSIQGRGSKATFKIEKIPSPFQEFCMDVLKFDKNTDFEKLYIPARQSTLHGVLVHTFRRYSARFPVISA